MLDHLERRQAAERVVGERSQVRQGVPFPHVEPLGPTGGGHLVVGVEAVGADTVPGEQLKELASAAARIEHVATPDEQRQVGRLPRPDGVAIAAEEVLEGDVLVARERVGRQGDSRRDGGAGGHRRGGSRRAGRGWRAPCHLAPQRLHGQLQRTERFSHALDALEAVHGGVQTRHQDLDRSRQPRMSVGDVLGDAGGETAHLVILGVDVGRDLLQERQQLRLDLPQLRGVPAELADRSGQRVGVRLVVGEAVRHAFVEGLLAPERRPNQSQHVTIEPAGQAAARLGEGRGEVCRRSR